MTHRSLRRTAITITVALTALAALSGCAWNPFQPSPGGTEFSMTADGVVKYSNNGRDIDHASGEVTFPNGARGKFRVAGSKGSEVAMGAVQQQAAINMALIAAIPKLSAEQLMRLLPLLAGVPVVAP